MNRILLKLPAQTASCDYPVLIGSNLLDQVAAQLDRGKVQNIFILADKRLSTLAAKARKRLGGGGRSVGIHHISATEKAKTYKGIFPIYGKMIESGVDRKGVLIAIGGGVIGDIGGFVAGTYLRGIQWMNLPTTLLAQVDSSVGGKTGVNHPLGKNLIGVFKQPSLVACDVRVLSTLPFRERVCGFGEMIKYGLAFDKEYFRYLSKHQNEILEGGDERVLSAAIRKSVEWKARIVSKDPLEVHGQRILLNLGHTVGHALETATKFKYFRHGEAVVWGMRAAAALSHLKGHLSEANLRDIDGTLSRIPVPPIPRVSFSGLSESLKRDKKSFGGKVTFVLLTAVGKTTLDRGVTRKDVRKALEGLGVRLAP